jgi:hypothetical protein
MSDRDRDTALDDSAFGLPNSFTPSIHGCWEEPPLDAAFVGRRPVFRVDVAHTLR